MNAAANVLHYAGALNPDLGVMAFFVYLVVAVVTVFGILLEMDVLVEPTHKIELAVTAPLKEKAPIAQRVMPETDARADEPTPVQAARAPAAVAVSDKCDVTACAAAYRTFRASDCTYEPREGVHELCTKGVLSDRAAAEAVLNAHADVRPGASAQCNVEVCSHAYISFSAADCTYQPLEGPRRLCTK